MLCGPFRYGSLCVSLQLFVRLGTHLANWPRIAFVCPSFQLALPCLCSSFIWAPIFPTRLAFPLVAQPWPCRIKKSTPSQNWFLSVLRLTLLPSAPLCGCFRYSSSCVWAPIFPTRLVLRLGAPLAKSPCLALGRPTLAMPY